MEIQRIGQLTGVYAISASCQFGTQLSGKPARHLYLTRVSLSDFRNYRNCSFTLDEGSAVLTGRNGSGKTNILEAISMLSPGRGLRGASFSDLACLKGAGGWTVSAHLSLNGDHVTVGTGQKPDVARAGQSSRVVRIDGEQASSSGILGDYLQVLWLIPAMDGLFTGAASERRRFLDRMVSTFDSAHRTRSNQFERAMRQRNKLLEMGERSERMFEAIEAQMAEIGTAVAAARIEALERLMHYSGTPVANGHNGFPHAVLALEGVLEQALQERPAVDVEDDYSHILASGRDRDRGAKRTLSGPHRCDLIVRHGPKDMPAALCSTGEQKALLIGLVLAHAKAVKDARGGLAPLLLLDEIAAHLDDLRREALFEEIETLGAQAWFTGTDREAFAPLRSRAQFFDIDDGTVTPMEGKDLPGPLPMRVG
ncbi:MAG: DNA replication/repair protein RecF [Hyphomicrobiales bacterium]|nr:DNA replication/repair protein RecF [Hyphomicrobiales bacterium]